MVKQQNDKQCTHRLLHLENRILKEQCIYDYFTYSVYLYIHTNRSRHIAQVLSIPCSTCNPPQSWTLYHWHGVWLNLLERFKSFLVNSEVILSFHRTLLDILLRRYVARIPNLLQQSQIISIKMAAQLKSYLKSKTMISLQPGGEKKSGNS